MPNMEDARHTHTVLDPLPASGYARDEHMFSVVIPSKNEEQDIGILLQSIRDQTIQPALLIVADKSTDRTRDIARSFNATVVEGQDDGRIGKARNKGAAYAKGDLLVFIDADIELPHSTFFEDMVTCFEALDLDLATCYYRSKTQNLNSILAFGTIEIAKRVDSVFKKGFSSGGGIVIIKTTVFNAVGRFNEDMRVSEDQDLATRAVKKGYRFGLIPLPIIVSSRRFTEGTPLRLLKITFGGVGTLLAATMGIRWLKKHRAFFEKLYGETGGKPPAR